VQQPWYTQLPGRALQPILLGRFWVILSRARVRVLSRIFEFKPHVQPLVRGPRLFLLSFNLAAVLPRRNVNALAASLKWLALQRLTFIVKGVDYQGILSVVVPKAFASSRGPGPWFPKRIGFRFRGFLGNLLRGFYPLHLLFPFSFPRAWFSGFEVFPGLSRRFTFSLKPVMGFKPRCSR